MPLLAFQCEQCGHVFEELVGVDKADEVACEDCGSEVSRRYQGKSLFGMIGKEISCGSAGDCGRAGTGCGCACRH